MKIPRVNKSGDGFIEDQNYLLQWPFNMVIIGRSGSGKGNLLLHMILTARFFNKPGLFYYYGPNAYQNDMLFLNNIMDKISLKIGYSCLKLESDVSKIPEPCELGNKEICKIVIFDDIITNHKIQDTVLKYFTHGRHQNISPIYLSQGYGDLPILLRQNTMYMIFYEPDTEFYRNLIEREHKLKKGTFNKVFNIDNTKQDNKMINYDFIFIDKIRRKYYKNFDEEI